MSDDELPACGNPHCSRSSGIHEGITFGHGHLDEHGFWEYPCRPCAAAFDAELPQIRQRILNDLLTAGNDPAKADQYVKEQEWLWEPGWPHEGFDIPLHIIEFQERHKEERARNEEFDRESRELFPELYRTDPPEDED